MTNVSLSVSVFHVYEGTFLLSPLSKTASAHRAAEDADWTWLTDSQQQSVESGTLFPHLPHACT